MVHLATELWSDVLGVLEQEINPQHFKTWFQNISIKELSDNRVVLLVPGKFASDWLCDHYYFQLQTAFERFLGTTPNISFDVNDSTSRPDQEAPEDLYIPEVTPAPPPTSRVLLSDSTTLLNSNYTFKEFVVGPSNRLPHAACVAVAENPANAYNPLFLHGAVGLGKTHLLQAVCHKILEINPSMRILYLSCEVFVNHFISAIQRGDLHDFRYRYRHIDALIIDDIHFLANKEQTQEEFFHTFNTLYQTKKQIVLSSDSPPSDIPSLENRLVSRFKMGLVTKIEPPVYETRVAILKQKAQLRGLDINDEALGFIADRIDANIRELEGSINSIYVFATSQDTMEVSLSLARKALADFLPTSAAPVSVSKIIEVVVGEYGVKFSELQSKKRAKSIVFPRQICMYLAKKLTGSSLSEIGSYFGNRDHSTVLYAVSTIEKKASSDPSLEATLKKLTRIIQSGS